MNHKKLLFSLFLTGPLLCAQPMGVCELMSNLSPLNGKEIKVRGVCRRGDAGQSLWAVPWCEMPTIRDGWEFVNAIQVGPAGGLKSALDYYRRYRQLALDHPGKNIYVTLWGVLDAPEHFEIWTDLLGMERPRAFGPFPAQLTFTFATDFKAVVPPPENQEEIRRRIRWEPRRPRPIAAPK